jgi:hypothetical protein
MGRPVTVEDMANDFVTAKVRYRGHTYVVTELSMKAYDKTVKQATDKDDDDGTETFDGQKHNRILMGATVTEDGEKVDVEDIYARGTRLVRALQRKIQSVHFDDEPEEEIEDEDEGEAAKPTALKSSASAS